MPIINNPSIIVKKSSENNDLLAYRISDLGEYSYENDTITSIKAQAFYYDNKLISIKCDNVTSIGYESFSYATNLKTVTFPKLTSMLTGFCFNKCSNLENVSLPLITSIVRYGFAYCGKLTNVYLPNMTVIYESAFDSCGITNIDLSKVTYIGAGAFELCKELLSFNAPLLKYPGNSMCQGCSKLTTVNLPSALSINNSCFKGCSSLLTITLGANQVCSLSVTSALPASETQHITVYVPADLIESYKTATNWSTLYNNGYIDFVAITE